MKLIENQILELKSNFTDGVKKEIIAFANAQGGTIYIGIDDNGTVQGINQDKLNEIELKIFNWLREGIKRNLTSFVKTEIKIIDEKYVFLIKVDNAPQKPYFLSDKGPKPSGVYIRVGNSMRQATFEEILQMQLESANINFELTKSPIKDLTFSYISDKFKAQNIEFNESKFKTLNFIDVNGEYIYTAYLFSDQNEIEIKSGRYKGIDRIEFESKKEFTGCILKQVDSINDYLNIINEVTVKFDGSPQRIEIPNYPKLALREAILNAIIHRDYMVASNVKLEFFDNRFEITSPGTLLKGITIDEILSGTSKLRNPSVAKIFEMLEYIEAYGTGFKRIFDIYNKFELVPEIVVLPNFFRVIMPNIKYSNNVGLNEFQNRIIELVKTNPSVTQKEIAKQLNVTVRTVERNISELRNKGIIIKKGSKKRGEWILLV